MTASEPTPGYAFILSADPPTKRDYWHVRADLVEWDGTTPGTILDGGDHDGLADLSVSAQNDPDNARSDRAPTAYGWSAAYSAPHRVTLRRAEAMHRTLAKIDRRTERDAERYGYPQTFAAYLLRVAAALAVDTFLVKETDDGSGWYSGQTYQTFTPRQAGAWIDGQDRRYIEAQSPTAEAVL
jgi:hypothetical protein